MKETLLKDYKKPNFLIPEVKMFINILEEKVIVKSELSLIKTKDGDDTLVLNGKDLKIVELKIDDIEVNNYTYKDDILTIKEVKSDCKFYSVVEIDPYTNKSMEGFYKSGEILCTQNEAEGFRRVTFFMDRPDIMSKYTITLEGDKKKYPYLLSNGNLIEKREFDNGRHSTKWHDPFAKPCYLTALVAGDLELTEDSYTTGTGRTIKLEIYTDHGNGARSTHAMESLKKSMIWDEEVFGLEYDLDLYMIVAVDSFNAGAMENKGLNIFNSVYVLADPETATDSNFESVEGVIAHEYFHNWTGNRVTCRDWFQLTLKEGLTVFRDQEFSSDMTDRTVKRINDVSLLRNYQFPEDRGPNSHPIKPESYMEIDNFYTATVYEKGAEVIRMIHTLIGKDKFREGMDLYFKRHDGQAVTTEDFVKAMSDASGHDLTQFKRWYSQAGTPVVDVKTDYNNGIFSLTVKQSVKKTAYGGECKPLYFPLNLGLYSYDGRDLTSEGKNQFIISKESQTFTFNTGEPVIPSLLQGYSAPVIINYNYSVDELITLLRADRDNFNRFDAARRLVMHSVEHILECIKDGKEPTIDSRIIDSYRELLDSSDLEKRYLATLLYTPEITNIVTTMEHYDFNLANRAKKTYEAILAKELKGALVRSFEDNVQEKYVFGKEAVARRSLKNRALSILSNLEDDIKEIALRQFKNADNMTDYLAAFSALQKCSDDTRKEANLSFYKKWKDNFLVMNMWFSVQAIRNSSSVLEDVKKLVKNEIFDKTNPNRIRSVYGAFAKSNKTQFHRADGEGYKFIANAIIDIDSYNSHASASLASAFQDFQYLKDDQASKMKVQLERIVSKENISPGLYEIISKTLETRK